MTTDIEALATKLERIEANCEDWVLAATILRSQAERIQALEAKCALLSASLAQSEKEVDELKHDIERHLEYLSNVLSAQAGSKEKS
jgi:predicted RNase H-like nuclease (RuvC/YqgF family)